MNNTNAISLMGDDKNHDHSSGNRGNDEHGDDPYDDHDNCDIIDQD